MEAVFVRAVETRDGWILTGVAADGSRVKLERPYPGTRKQAVELAERTWPGARVEVKPAG